MPDADTVWLTPLDEMVGPLAEAGLAVRRQEDHSARAPLAGPRADRRVRRGRRGNIAALGRTRSTSCSPPTGSGCVGWSAGVRKLALVAPISA